MAQMATSTLIYTQDLSTMCAEYLTNWIKGSATLTVLVAGKTGTGKSTLINKLLKLTGRARAPESDKLKATTTEMKLYQNTIGGGVQVKMWDTPGEPGNADFAKIKRIFDEVDLVLFCINMSATKYDKSEHYKSIDQYSKALGINMWKRTMFILTFADKYISRVTDSTVPEAERTKTIASWVQAWKLRLHSTLGEAEIMLDPDTVNKTKAISFASNGIRGHNASRLWQEAISVTRLAARPAVLKIHQSDAANPICLTKPISLQLVLSCNKDFSVKSPVEPCRDRRY